MTNTREVPVETDLAVRWLLARYSQLIDDRDHDAAVALFTEDARLHLFDREYIGQDAIRSWMGTIPGEVFHHVTNVVTSNGSHGTVHAVSDVASGIRADATWSVRMLARYHDTMVGSGRDIRLSQRIVTAR